ncbi:MAG: hypothetical protein M1817_006892 [Caeruleum heppii]|nr:MAG: hypothetical protein M1817_006892 [Caeruleum heppii]
MAEFPESDSPTGKPDADTESPLDGARDMEGLTLYEKKALLINRELDGMGMGKYQWCIFILCGFGYMLDLLWAQAFGLVASPLQQELGFSGSGFRCPPERAKSLTGAPDVELGNIFTSFSAGLCAGAFVWGVLVDIVGRRWAFNLTVLISSIFGLCLGAPSTYNGIIVLTAFVGFGVGGNIPIDTTITLEFLPQNRRFLLAALSVFQPIGVVICSAIAYGFIPNYSCAAELQSCNTTPGEACCGRSNNMGWRYLLFTLGAITLFVFFARFVLFRFQESPKFLLYRGRDDEVIRVLQKVAAFNKRECTLTLEQFEELESNDASRESSGTGSAQPVLGGGFEKTRATTKQKFKMELSRYKMLFATSTMIRLTILTWITYAFDYWGFTIAGSFLPTVLARKNAQIEISLRTTYRNYIIIYVCGIPAVLLAATLWRVPLLGRKYTMVISSALMATSLFLFAAVNSPASNIGFNAMEYFFQSLFNAVLYGWTPEAFPAPVRGTAAGVASFWGRLASIVAPLVAAHLLSRGPNDVLYLAGGGVLVCTVATALLPSRAMTGKAVGGKGKGQSL